VSRKSNDKVRSVQPYGSHSQTTTTRVSPVASVLVGVYVFILLRYLTLSLKVMLICVQAGRWQTVRGMPGDDVTMVTCHMWIDEAAHDAYDGSAIRWDSG